MEAPTPTFGKNFSSKRKKHSNFSKTCEKLGKIKPKGKKSCMNLNKLDNNLKKEKSKLKKEKPKRHHSQNFKIKDYADICEINDNKSHYSKSNNKKSKKYKIL